MAGRRVSGHGARLVEVGKWIGYRTPGVRRLAAPRYPYMLDPAQLAAMVDLVDATRGSGALVAEVGVAKGFTSVFLLEHLRSVGDERYLWLFDTFSGFTRRSIDIEVSRRGKSASDFVYFAYGREEQFAENLRRLGYARFRTVRGDASEVDWSEVGPVAAMLLDIDLYQPTLDVLQGVYDQLIPGGGIVVDDCLADTQWDGSLQAYEEVIAARGLPFRRVGRKGALIRKPQA